MTKFLQYIKNISINKNIFFSILGVIVTVIILGGFLYFYSQQNIKSPQKRQFSNTQASKNIGDNYSNKKQSNSKQEKSQKNTNIVYTSFSMNVHDFVFPDKSIATLNKILDIHEENNVPIDVYLTDAVLKKYLKESPELIERLKISSVVSICYHVRPPYPWYEGFDTVGLDKLENNELKELLIKYESQEIDMETGGLVNKPGGYKFMKKIFGKAPIIVGVPTTRQVANTLSEIYKEMGATFSARHSQENSIGAMKDGLYIRPENADIQLYTYVDSKEIPSKKLDEALNNLSNKGQQFINIKFHENNFYTHGTPFWSIYYKTLKKEIPLSPPWNLTKPEKFQVFKEDNIQKKYWEIYEDAVKHVADNREEFNPINADDLEGLVQFGNVVERKLNTAIDSNKKIEDYGDKENENEDFKIKTQIKPVLYIVSMMHSEENVHFETDEKTFNNVVKSLKKLEVLFNEHDAKIDIGPDWTFVQAVLNFEPDFLTKHLALGHGIHTHAHETIDKYNIKGVSDLLLRAGVVNRIANGGWGQTSSERISEGENWVGYLEDLKTDSEKPLFTTVVAFKNSKTQEPSKIGYIFKPSKVGDWRVNNPNGRLIYIGGGSTGEYKANVFDFNTYQDRINDKLVNLDPTKINTLFWHDSIHNYINPIKGVERTAQWEKALEEYFDPLIESGQIEWKTFQEMSDLYFEDLEK